MKLSLFFIGFVSILFPITSFTDPSASTSAGTSATTTAELSAATPVAAAVKPFDCQTSQILKSPHSTFLNRKNATYWVATEKTSFDLFKRLKFRLISRQEELRAKKLIYSAMQACPVNIDITKIYLASHGADSLKTTNQCEEEIAIALGFHKSGIEGDGYGAIETGHPIQWRTLFVCTDGHKFTNCNRPTLEMQKCFESLANRIDHTISGPTHKKAHRLKKH